MRQLRTFGGLSIQDDGASLTGAATQRRTLALLALLAAAHNHGTSRDKLIACLWPESDAEHGRNLLKQACFGLRRDLHEPELFLGTTELRLNPAAISSDVHAFQEAVERGDLAGAVALYRGPFLDGFYLNGGGEFERWVETERARLKQCACQALEALASVAPAPGDQKGSVAWWRRLAALEPLNARIARGLMGALAATGDRAGALQHARIHEALLRQELDVAPDPAVTEFVRRLREAPEERAPTPAAAVVATERLVSDAQPAEPLSVLVATTLGFRRGFRVATWRAVGAALTAVVGGLLYSHFKTGAALDSDLVAVAPFDVLAPKVDLWREGLVDVVSRNLDGAGPLRTVAPTVVIRRWRGRADNVSAAELGRRTGARIVLFGGILGAGRDSVRLSATLFDTRSGGPLAEIEYRDAAAHMDRLSDSLTVAVLRELGRTRPIAAVRLASLGSRSLPAIKAFLRGEQFYRRLEFDSALAYFQRALVLDSTFTLALRRLPLVLWSGAGAGGLDTVGVLMLKEGAHNHGLAPRESLLVTVDSLWGALGTGEAEPWPLLRRLAATLDDAVRRYPDDAEVWNHRGELGVHWGSYTEPPITAQQTLEALDRSIALDSEFGPAYDHAVTLALLLRGPADARRYLSAYTALGKGDGSSRVLDGLLDPNRARSPEMARMLDTASADALGGAAVTIARWEDSAQTQLRVARAYQAARHGFRYVDASLRDWGLALTLAYRGRLHEAYANLRRNGALLSDVLFAELAMLGGVPRDSATAMFRRWLDDSEFGTGVVPRRSGEVLEGALGWWAEIGDTGSIRTLARRIAAAPRSGPNPERGTFRRYAAAAAPAYLALARHDTTEALGRFALVPDSLCFGCYLERLTRARLLARRGRDGEALRLLDTRVHAIEELLPSEVSWAFERARVNERLGNRDRAVRDYAFVTQMWAHADSSLQPLVAEARGGLKRLGGEQRLAATTPWETR